MFCSLKVSKYVFYLSVFLNSHNLEFRAHSSANKATELRRKDVLLTRALGVSYKSKIMIPDTIKEGKAAEPEPCRKITDAECFPAGLTAQSCSFLAAAMAPPKYRENQSRIRRDSRSQCDFFPLNRFMKQYFYTKYYLFKKNKICINAQRNVT